MNDVIEELNKEGNKHLKDHEHREALWKYLYSKKICHEHSISGKLSQRACVNIAIAALRLLDSEVPTVLYIFRHSEALIDYVYDNCTLVIKQKDAEKKFRRKASLHA